MVNRLIIFLLLFCATNLYAQNTNFRFKHFNVEDGLSNPNAICFLEDSKGFLWIGTKDGLNRFDGYEFKHYKYNFASNNTVSDNFIYCLEEDKKGNIWVGTSQSGLSKYSYLTDDFLRYEIDSIPNINIEDIHRDKYGDLWVASILGLARFDYNENKFTIYDLEPDSVTPDNVYSLNENNGVLVIGTLSNGLYYYNRQANQFHRFQFLDNGKLSPIENKILFIESDSNYIWFGNAEEGLFRYDTDTKQLKNYKASITKGGLTNNEISHIYKDSRNNIWVGNVNGGIHLYNRSSDSFTTFSHDKYDEFSISSNSINDIYEDSYGNLWFCGYYGGLSYFNYNLLSFKSYKNIPGDSKSLSNDVVGDFCIDKFNNIWVGTNNGINLFNPIEGKFEFYSPKPNQPTVCNHLQADGKGNIYIAAWGEGLSVFNPSNKSFKNISKHQGQLNSLQSLQLKELYIDSKGHVWLAVHRAFGVHIYHPETKEFFHNDKQGDYAPRLFGVDFVTDIFEDSKKRIWLVSYTGLYMYNGEFHEFISEKSNRQTISSNYVYTVFEDNNGTIWVGSANGLDKFVEDSSGFLFERYSEEFELPDNIKAILQDDEGDLWLSSNKGLIEFTPKNGKIKRYTVHNGLQGDSFKEKAAYKTKNGEMLFGGYNGFNYFHPNKIKTNEKAPKVYITGFQIFNKEIKPKTEESVLQKSIIETKELTLSYEHSVISFEYVALNFMGIGQNKYAYYLEGFDNDWNYVGTERKATYTNLDPGAYTFKVMAANENEVWSSGSTQIKITILPPFWDTLWFKALIILIISGSLLLFYLWRVKDLKNQRKILFQKVEERTRELQQSNEELEVQKEEIFKKSQQIKNKNEELTASEEELSMINNQLLEQRDELEQTVQQLKETQLQLVQSEKMASVGILTAGIAHEINNPLNFIEGGKYALNDYIEENIPEHKESLKPFLGIIEQGINRTSNIIQSLNRFNRNTTSSKDVCILADIIENCLVMLQNLLKHRITVSKEYTKKSYQLLGNEGELHQVVLNLLTNAAQAIKGKGNISISTKIYNNNLLLTIEDDGCGMSQEDLKKVTDPFFTTKMPGEGTGLGMSIAYSIIKQHGGKLQYKSELGKGTMAMVSFPVNLNST